MDNKAFNKIKKFFSQYPEQNYKKNETILRAGDMPQGVYFLEEGYVKLYSTSADGEELTLVIYQPGEFFPVVWTFFGERPSIYYFATMSPVVVRRADREPFVKFLEENPDAFMFIMLHVLDRFQRSLRRMEYLVFGNAASRLASTILSFGRTFGRDIKGKTEIQLPLTHKDFADLLGMTRETVSIQLKKFERKGFIGYNAKKLFVIKDKEKLGEEAILL